MRTEFIIIWTKCKDGDGNSWTKKKTKSTPNLFDKLGKTVQTDVERIKGCRWSYQLSLPFKKHNQTPKKPQATLNEKTQSV